MSPAWPDGGARRRSRSGCATTSAWRATPSRSRSTASWPDGSASWRKTEPEYRSVAFDISLSERFQGEGLGPDALRTLIRWFADERGHHRFTIDPNAENEPAIKAYAAVGFKPVGIMRRAELVDGEWSDGLFMDLLIEELR